MNGKRDARWGAAIVAIAPAVLLAGLACHPWIGNPFDADFHARLAAAVTGDPTRWALAHLAVGVGSGLLVIAFLAIRSWLREAGGDRWSGPALPFIVLGSTLYAMLPGMEFAPLAAAGAGGDAEATQAALLSWFVPILYAGATIFLVGALGFARDIGRGKLLGPGLSGVVVVALVVMAAARFVPLGVAQLYVEGAAAIVALWPLAYGLWTWPVAESAGARAAVAGPGDAL